MGPFLQFSPPKSCTYFSSPPQMLHGLHIPFFSISSQVSYPAGCAIHEASHKTVSSSSCFAFTISYKYLPRHPVLEFPKSEISSFTHTYERTGEIIYFCLFQSLCSSAKHGTDFRLEMHLQTQSCILPLIVQNKEI